MAGLDHRTEAATLFKCSAIKQPEHCARPREAIRCIGPWERSTTTLLMLSAGRKDGAGSRCGNQTALFAFRSSPRPRRRDVCGTLWTSVDGAWPRAAESASLQRHLGARSQLQRAFAVVVRAPAAFLAHRPLDATPVSGPAPPTAPTAARAIALRSDRSLLALRSACHSRTSTPRRIARARGAGRAREAGSGFAPARTI